MTGPSLSIPYVIPTVNSLTEFCKLLPFTSLKHGPPPSRDPLSSTLGLSDQNAQYLVLRHISSLFQKALLEYPRGCGRDEDRVYTQSCEIALTTKMVARGTLANQQTIQCDPAYRLSVTPVQYCRVGNSGIGILSPCLPYQRYQIVEDVRSQYVNVSVWREPRVIGPYLVLS
ncbi:hypothetical protein BDY19DRAFT_394204 [Irpex rosettiformis]|uniref:Uncharacterized protein n=1 Tax=Irpex rosettiformis TaxID=378272 RepID=A0ACB8TUR0_9APHY|nr:hypothetical protein BDY19DRAFT_394204 [Irpex rosettiformis]